MDNEGGNRFRILVADDEEYILDLYQDILSRTGIQDSRNNGFHGVPTAAGSPSFELTMCLQGEDALEAVRTAVAANDPFAVAFLDVHMPPGQGGILTAEQIRALDPNVNIVIVTGYSDTDPVDVTVRVPPADKLLYMQKPLYLLEILQIASSLGAKWKVEKQLLQIQNDLEKEVTRRTSKLLATTKELRDEIKERKRAQEESRQQQQQLFQAHKMVALGTLVSGVAHEVSNPNNTMLLCTSALKKLCDDLLPVLDAYGEINCNLLVGNRPYTEVRKEIRELVDVTTRAAERIKNIVSDLKDFARKDDSNLLASVNINKIVKSAVTLLSSMIKKSTNHFSAEYDDNLPLVQGNTQRIDQVVVNLLTNACQALPNADRSIHVSTSHGKDPESVLVEIRDEGRGISRRDLCQITDPFFTTRHNSGGTGLGLSISQKIIDSHHGTLSFTSKLNQGTTATIMLPGLTNRDNNRNASE